MRSVFAARSTRISSLLRPNRSHRMLELTNGSFIRSGKKVQPKTDQRESKICGNIFSQYRCRGRVLEELSEGC